MIVTCASCLTKFNLDNSRIPSKGTKVRCSRCRHVFFIVPPPETREEVDENFESFAKYHEELFKPGEKEEGDEGESFEAFAKYHKELFKPGEKEEVKEDSESFAKYRKELPKPKEREEEFPEFPSQIEFEKEPTAEAPPEEEEEETFFFSEKTSAAKGVQTVPSIEKEAEAKTVKPKRMVRRERRSPLAIALVIFLILLAFGTFYSLRTGVGSKGQLSSYIEYPLSKVAHLWSQIWGTEKRGLTIGDLTGYEERIGEFPLFIIEGKVNNQSGLTKKLIKVRVAIFEQNRVKVTEKETVCGRIIGRDELKLLPADFFVGEIVIKPKSEKEMIVPSGKTTPFMVIFKHLSSQGKGFTVEIVEAPNL
ncbi:MAG: zinc-ribbon domain-containing protein [Thermodesulfobacteriota bacterium]|jgi:predicted Zn finger-like uncharacterized protein